MTAFVTVLITNLLPCIAAGYYQEMRLIAELNNFFNFDHNIFLLDRVTHINRFINTSALTPKSLFVFNGNDDINTGTKIQSKNTFTIIVPESSKFVGNFDLLQRLKKIHQLQINVKIGIFFQEFASTEDLQQLFEWCKEQLIINIFAAAYLEYEVSNAAERLLNIFTYHPVGVVKIDNVTGLFHLFFTSRDSNFHQSQLKVESNYVFVGVALWRTVSDLMNATFVEVERSHTTEKEAFENGIDVVSQIYTQEELRSFQVCTIKMEYELIVFPEALPYPDFSAYLRTVTSDEFFGYSLLTVAAVMLLLSISRYVKQKKFLIFESIADVLNLLLNDNGYINYQRLSRSEIFIIVPLTFVGFVIVNGILSNLQSYLTRPVYQPNIKTFEDLYRSAFPILIQNEVWKRDLMYALSNRTKLSNWSDKILVAKKEKIRENILTYNRSVSFLTNAETVNVLLRIQKRLNIRCYDNEQLQVYVYHMYYPVNPNFPFVERLNEIVHRIQSAGLFDLWTRQHYAEREKNLIKMNLERMKNLNETLNEADVNSIEFPKFIIYGWIAGITMLVIEIVWKKLDFSKIKYFLRRDYVVSKIN